jgi:hypothetical protein
VVDDREKSAVPVILKNDPKVVMQQNPVVYVHS